jgi:hypothetical protein
VSVGWLLSAPLLLTVALLTFKPAIRRSASGLAVGAGLAFVYFASTAQGRP